MLRPVIYSHFRPQCKAKVVGRVLCLSQKNLYTHRSVFCYSAFTLLLSATFWALTASIKLQALQSQVLMVKRTLFTLMLLRVLESLVLLHKRLLQVNKGEKTTISQFIYITCNVIRRLNTSVEESCIRLNLSLITWKAAQSQGSNSGVTSSCTSTFYQPGAGLGLQPNSSSASPGSAPAFPKGWRSLPSTAHSPPASPEQTRT